MNHCVKSIGDLLCGIYIIILDSDGMLTRFLIVNSIKRYMKHKINTSYSSKEYFKTIMHQFVIL